MIEMKILILTPYYYPYTSGMTVYAKRLAEGLAINGHQVTVLTYKHEKDIKEREIINGVRIVRVPFILKFQRGVFSFSFLFKFIKLAKNNDIVNIHIPFFEAGLIVIISKILSKKVILTYHCDLKLRNGLLSYFVNKIYFLSILIAATLSNKIVVNSYDYVKGSMIKNFMHKTFCIYPPIEEKKFFYTKNTKKFKERFKISSRDFVIGFLGRLTWEKGLEYLILAMRRIVKNKKNVKLLIAGESEKIAGGKKESVKEKLLKMINKFNLNNKVIFTGFIEERELIKFYSSCDIIVVPSYDRLESFNLVQIEAMLCKTPVIVTDMPGVRTPVLLTKGGILIKPKDEKGLVKAILKILKNKKRYIVARKDVTKYFRLSKTIKEYERLFFS
jgi:glycosyltransferase involved in cell wall biosynthesis